MNGNLKEEEILNELTIFGDIKHCWGIYDIEEWDTEDEINEGLKCVSDLSLEYRHIHVVLKRKLGDNYNEKYPDYDKNVHSLTMFIKNIRKRLRLIKSVESNTKIDKNILVANSLYKEISIRCESLEAKFIQEWNALTDYQLLEISQDKGLESQFNVILEKVTSLAPLVAGGGDAGQKMLDNAIVKRDSVLKNKTLFEKNLQNILADRDITPDKMKNASMLKIELPRFSGYEGRMDLFTFKSEFQKLIEPTVQKKYLADYLKRNYLTGTALTLVEKEKDYNKIWARLLESLMTLGVIR